MDRFREYTFKEHTINQTKEIVNNIYDKWLEAKSQYDDKVLDILSDTIYITYEVDIKYSEFPEKKEFWFDKFKDEEIIINKFKQLTI